MRSGISNELIKNKKSRYLVDRILTISLWILTVIVLFLIAALLLFILSKGLPKLTPHFFFGLPDEILAGGGVGPFLINSFYVLFISLVISIPIGVGSGIYLSEYAPNNRLTEFIRTCVESLATVPSIVFGLFGYVVFVDIFNIGLTILGAGVALSLLNLPVITRVTEVSLQAVPAELREASYALGSTKSKSIVNVVVPVAMGGILTGLSLATCRAFGESAVILLVGGTGTSGNMWDFNLLSQGGTLPVHLWYLQSSAIVEDAADIADMSAAVLVLIVLIISLTMRFPLWLRDYKMRSRMK
ncbi:phosphate ABC transporter permease PstA [Paenisporosarcina sp. FSL H8-0542]|uniref:phosphate ABC transporter permease PstA n=1 Tax=unclassified Paenisporosarcina TaxID=2642018 RepID=UPI00034EBA37|nr:phosphate ABC transporter permease PstA [Paenisporosarcina sp. HGH0030]EPD52278.1 phosphate ABC transporter, permease PstA [Paenisporosarcina sp. HGH0030]